MPLRPSKLYAAARDENGVFCAASASAMGGVLKICFQDFGKIILKNNLENKSRLFFKILAKICLNKITDFTTYL